MTADELLYKFDLFFEIPTCELTADRGRPLSFEQSVTPVELMFFSSRSTHVLAQFFLEILLNKRSKLLA